MKGGQPGAGVFGGNNNKKKGGMRGGSFAEVGAGASGQLTAGNGMGVTGAGEIATGGKLGPIAAHASVDGMTIAHEGIGMKGGRRHRKRKSVKRSSAKRSGSKRKSVKRRSSKRKSTKNKRRSSKRKSRKH
jgi:hypothetical protein